jgi:hypothetical protein
VTDLVSIVHWGPTGVTRIWTGPSGIVTVAVQQRLKYDIRSSQLRLLVEKKWS